MSYGTAMGEMQQLLIPHGYFWIPNMLQERSSDLMLHLGCVKVNLDDLLVLPKDNCKDPLSIPKEVVKHLQGKGQFHYKYHEVLRISVYLQKHKTSHTTSHSHIYIMLIFEKEEQNSHAPYCFS